MAFSVTWPIQKKTLSLGYRTCRLYGPASTGGLDGETYTMAERRIPSEFLGTVRVLPKLPKALSGLEDLAYNIWWAWNPYARALFRQIHSETWIKCQGNPMLFMSSVKQEHLEAAAKDKEVLKLYDSMMKQLNEYVSAKGSWYSRTHKGKKNVLVAYFSAEFGLHESLPIYSGGLGVLAGDHCKSASDIGLPFVAVGMLYREGYFIQKIDAYGHQIAEFRPNDWRDLPIRPALNSNGEEVVVEVEMPDRILYGKVWKVQVGRNPLYLLDTDIPQNNHEDRKLTSRLYGGGEEMRIQQEILLGIGGVRALRALGHQPTVFHMNEGHSVFLGLERLREYIHNEGLSFREAVEIVRASTLFTTHTPVPAGNDAFPPPMVEKYFRPFWESIGVSRTRFMTLGLDTSQDSGRFSLTILALNLAAMANGVSELHGHVSRSMWQHVWGDVPASENPIDHITNGVHTRTWLSIDMQCLFDKYFDKDWRERLEQPDVWKKVDRIPDTELWEVINKLRKDMVDFVHTRVTSQHSRFGESFDEIREWAKVLDPDTLTIGFARRFATYKRATLIFRDKERLARILSHPERPIQIVFSGKAHPADKPGQELIRQVQEMSKDPAFRGKIIFLENYDMNVGRRLTSGVDVWLNNPRRPLEASGTSGMKVPLNGGINCSILDGWWREAFYENPKSGWALGEETEYSDPNRQDEADAESIYQTLEMQVAPLFYDRDENGIPVNWLARVRESMKTVGPRFSTNRMVEEYTEKFYHPGTARQELLISKRYDRARKNAEWKEKMRAAWPGIRIKAYLDDAVDESATIRVKDKLNIVAEVDLGSISPDDVQVEIYVAPINATGNGGVKVPAGSIPMRPDGKKKDNNYYTYRGSLMESDSGEYGYTVRVVPKHPDLVHPQELGLVSWAHSPR